MINATDRQTDRRTDDRQTTCDRKIALCTVVHLAVKNEVDPMTRCVDMAIRNSTYHEGRRESLMVPFERPMVISWVLGVTIALSLTIFGRNLPSNVCDVQINTGWVTFGQNFRGVLFGVNLWCWGLQRANTPRLASSEIILEEFQPMSSRYLNVTDRQTDHRRTDDLP